ncbi:pyridoxamine 5'-phosphate oxidase family protein [Macrococcus brunensis]|uniref:pyridoxamine 5'-phosphate oxidase family protein n=1 Tax=Macrococcus brunensis TaxID=198483 RepID=UPI001EEF79CD|nr:pyridoxamine 5'-phosphate oxidase family protein [Macrococcus brunensis]ULG74317.1 pyridoxamine 5'-phosphate oxidase family protein [Macrococcus brunensis]
MTEQISNEEKRQRLYDLLEKNDIAMLTTISDNKLVARPMGYKHLEDDADLWFFTLKDTDKADEIQKDNRVNVSFSKEGYASISGTVHIVEDDAKKKELWSKPMEAFLHTSCDDPNVILLKVEAESAEYWSTDQTVKTVIDGFKRLFQGDQKDKDESMNDTVEL